MDGGKIEKLVDTAMNNITEMVDVNTIVGEAVETINGSVIIPISRVSFGFVCGGGDMELKCETEAPFLGGSGAGISLKPIAFLVVTKDQVRLLPVNKNDVVESVINIAPEIIKEIKNILE